MLSIFSMGPRVREDDVGLVFAILIVSNSVPPNTHIHALTRSFTVNACY